MNKLTISIWMRIDENSVLLTNLLSKEGSYSIGYSIDDQRFYFNIKIRGGLGGYTLNFPPPDTLELGKWYHFAVMYDAGTEVKKPKFRAYLDGKIFYDWTPGVEVVPNAPDLIENLVGYPLSIGSLHTGLIDDLRIYKDNLF